MSTNLAAVLGIAILLLFLFIAAASVGWHFYLENLHQQQLLDDTVGDLRRTREELQLVTAEAGTDDLTSLPNRRGLLRHMGRALDDEPAVAVALLDLDAFKAVNDTYGHGAGDDVLLEVAARLTRLPDPVLFAARLAGDEFVLVIRGTTDGALHIAERARQAITAPICVRGQWVTVGVSIGVITDAIGLPAAALLHHADHAMYQAKNTGSGIFVHALRPDTI